MWLSTAAIAAGTYAGIYMRMTSALSNANCYRLDGIGPDGPYIYRGASGFFTLLASHTATYTQGWYQFVGVAQGTSITLAVQRGSDNFWQQTDGTWAATRVNCLSVTDSTVPTGSASYMQLGYYTVSGFVAGDGFDQLQWNDMSVSGNAAGGIGISPSGIGIGF